MFMFWGLKTHHRVTVHPNVSRPSVVVRHEFLAYHDTDLISQHNLLVVVPWLATPQSQSRSGPYHDRHTAQLNPVRPRDPARDRHTLTHPCTHRTTVHCRPYFRGTCTNHPTANTDLNANSYPHKTCTPRLISVLARLS